MRYERISLDKELLKMLDGKTKTDVRMLLYLAVRHYPAIQKQIAEAFSITK